METYFKNYLEELAKYIQDVDNSKLLEISEQIATLKGTSNKVLIFGNGGSAGIASHVAVDMTKNAGVATSTYHESGLLSCFANDYGYEHWVARAIEFYANPGDMVILISSSGKSMNMINGAEQAKKQGLKIFTLSGFKEDNPLRTQGDVNLYIQDERYNYVEMAHNIWLLAIVDYIITHH